MDATKFHQCTNAYRGEAKSAQFISIIQLQVMDDGCLFSDASVGLFLHLVIFICLKVKVSHYIVHTHPM